MATFEKKLWQDRISEHPTRRTLTDVSTGDATLVDVARAEGTVTNAGDAFNASNMNDLENRIDAVVQEMDENFQAGVDAVYNACVAVGIIPASSTPTDIAAAISNMAGADATAAQILAGKKAYANGALLTGTMPNRGAWIGATTGSGNVLIPAGYHSGRGYVSGAGAYNAGRSQGQADLWNMRLNILHSDNLWRMEVYRWSPSVQEDLGTFYPTADSNSTAHIILKVGYRHVETA